jgi:hypothetical protein
MLRCMGLALWMAAACLSPSPLPERTKEVRCVMDSTDKRVADKFAAFNRGRDPGLVQEALDLVLAAQRALPAGDAAARNGVISSWLRFFALLDQIIDPQWDPQKLPVKGAAPPATHGAVYPSGEVDPATIPDPVERAEYERALAASKEYERWYDAQFQLRRIDERALRFVERLAIEDRQEFDRLVAATSSSEARKQTLMALAPESPGSSP